MHLLPSIPPLFPASYWTMTPAMRDQVQMLRDELRKLQDRQLFHHSLAINAASQEMAELIEACFQGVATSIDRNVDRVVLCLGHLQTGLEEVIRKLEFLVEACQNPAATAAAESRRQGIRAYLRGIQNQSSYDVDLARRYFLTALDGNEEDVEAHYWFARLLTEQDRQDYDRAASHFRRAAIHAGEQGKSKLATEAHLRVADVMCRANEHMEAYQECQRAAEYTPNSADIEFLTAKCLIGAGDEGNAAEWLRQAIFKNPSLFGEAECEPVMQQSDVIKQQLDYIYTLQLIETEQLIADLTDWIDRYRLPRLRPFVSTLEWCVFLRTRLRRVSEKKEYVELYAANKQAQQAIEALWKLHKEAEANGRFSAGMTGTVSSTSVTIVAVLLEGGNLLEAGKLLVQSADNGGLREVALDEFRSDRPLPDLSPQQFINYLAVVERKQKIAWPTTEEAADVLRRLLETWHAGLSEKSLEKVDPPISFISFTAKPIRAGSHVLFHGYGKAHDWQLEDWSVKVDGIPSSSQGGNPLLLRFILLTEVDKLHFFNVEMSVLFPSRHKTLKTAVKFSVYRFELDGSWEINVEDTPALNKRLWDPHWTS